LALLESSAMRRTSSPGSSLRGRVPLIGRVSTTPSRTERKRSGEEDSTWPKGKLSQAENGAGLRARSAR